jgi:uncharacterized protein GlcG (DUF336 family)
VVKVAQDGIVIVNHIDQLHGSSMSQPVQFDRIDGDPYTSDRFTTPLPSAFNWRIVMRTTKTNRRLLFVVLVAAIAALASGSPFETRVAAAGPGGLSHGDIANIIDQAVNKANTTASGNGLRSDGASTRPTKMVIAIVARDGKLLRIYAQPDAWVGSQDIAIAKARTAAFFSSDENALTSRIVGVLSQPGQPLWGIGNSNQVGITGSPEFRNGIITFPGGVPLYKAGLVGGIGVSGDGVDQDEAVAFGGAVGYAPGAGVVKLGMNPPIVPSFP